MHQKSSFSKSKEEKEEKNPNPQTVFKSLSKS